VAKAGYILRFYGTAEAVPFQSWQVFPQTAEGAPFKGSKFPSSCKTLPFDPVSLYSSYGTAEAVPLQIPRTAEKMKCRSIRPFDSPSDARRSLRVT
jgi:hypothetical protein